MVKVGPGSSLAKLVPLRRNLRQFGTDAMHLTYAEQSPATKRRRRVTRVQRVLTVVLVIMAAAAAYQLAAFAQDYLRALHG